MPFRGMSYLKVVSSRYYRCISLCGVLNHVTFSATCPSVEFWTPSTEFLHHSCGLDLWSHFRAACNIIFTNTTVNTVPDTAVLLWSSSSSSLSYFSSKRFVFCVGAYSRTRHSALQITLSGMSFKLTTTKRRSALG
jgi:hypothetical protein